MLVSHLNRDITKHGLQKIQEFTIKTDRKSFEILSSNLYSNNIRAIVRELGTNAYDSHVDARNHNIPFDVYLPNKLSNTFKIRDYGTGMNRDKIEKLYTNYFSSDKSHSNDFVGCLGLGSKSPLSYTSNFALTSFVDGQRHDYMVFISENGTPSLGYIGTKLTKEKNGVEISFTVKESDFQKFHNEASNIYPIFATIPNVIGGDIKGIDITKRTNHLWTIKKNRPSYSYGADSKLCCLMGNVIYQINSHEFTSSERQLINALFGSYGLTNLLVCPIGSVDITPSREGLQYTLKTREAIIKLCRTAINEIRNATQDKINLAKTWLEASYILTDMVQNYPYMHQTQGLEWKWQNIKVYDGREIPISSDYNSEELIGLSVNGTTYHLRKFLCYKITDEAVEGKHLRFIYGDCPGFKILSEYLSLKFHCTYAVIRNSNTLDFLVNQKYITKNDILNTSVGKQIYPEAFTQNQSTTSISYKPHNGGQCKYPAISKFKKGIYLSGYKSKLSKTPKYRLWSKLTPEEITKINGDQKTFYTYVEINRGTPIHYNSIEQCARLYDIWNQILPNSNDVKILYGIKKNELKYYSKQHNWLELKDVIKETMNKIVQKTSFQVWYSHLPPKALFEGETSINEAVKQYINVDDIEEVCLANLDTIIFNRFKEWSHPTHILKGIIDYVKKRQSVSSQNSLFIRFIKQQTGIQSLEQKYRHLIPIIKFLIKSGIITKPNITLNNYEPISQADLFLYYPLLFLLQHGLCSTPEYKRLGWYTATARKEKDKKVIQGHQQKIGQYIVNVDMAQSSKPWVKTYLSKTIYRGQDLDTLNNI